MPAITWSEKYSVKNQTIDAQHRKLVDLINQLDEAMRAGKGKDALGQCLTELTAYATTHFTTEERLLAKHGYTELPKQITEHQDFIRQVMELQQKFQQSRIGLTIPVMNFLTKWLTNHILGTDMKYSAFLQSKGV